MNRKRNLHLVLTSTLAAALLAVGGPALVAETASSPASATPVIIAVLTGTLLDAQGRPLKVGSALQPGATVKTPPGRPVRLMLAQGAHASSIISIEPDSEVAFVKFSASTDEDYPLLDTELSLRHAQVRAEAKRIF